MEITIEQKTQRRGTHPLKFILWLFMVSISMVFAAFTSAYIVRRGDGNWLIFELPQLFWISTALIVVSSITMHIAYLSAKKDNLSVMRTSLIITTLLGIGFMVTQYLGWQELQANGIFLGGKDSNPAGSFVYVISGVHAFHVVSGVIFLIITLIQGLRYKIHSKQMITMSLCTSYWHYLDLLWVYLFVFLLIIR
ncbi:MAG: cytochrome c oxidase subunit 3 [Bernardetiaceae bacterium]|nr:cytochrome c oxidase subunit 3 [Bernardetiaceae bacterium]